MISGTSFKAVWWSISEKNAFWAKTSLFFVFRGPNSVHSEVFRSWWSQWYKFQSCMMIHFWEKKHILAKTSLSFVFRGPNSVYPEVFRCDDHNGTVSFKAVWWSQWFSKKTHFGLKHHFPLYRGLERFWGVMIQTSFSCMIIHFWGYHSVRGPNSVHSEVFRSDDHNGTSFKAVWWSISEKNNTLLG